MAETRERAQIDVYLNQAEALQRLRELEQEADKLGVALKKATTPQEKRAIRDQLKEIKTEIQSIQQQAGKRVDLLINGSLAGASMKELEMASNRLWNELKKLPTTSQEFIDKSKRYREISANLRELQQEAKGTGGIFNRIKDEMLTFWAIFMSYLGVQAFIGQLRNIITNNAKVSDSIADIRKTTGLAAEEADKLNKNLGKINTRTATQELREMAVVAGQLGIAQDKISKSEKLKLTGDFEGSKKLVTEARLELEGFVASIDKATVALGDEFTGGAQQVANEFGKMRNVFYDVKTADVAGDILRIGNAVNVLSAAGAATGPVVADFANRIGGVAIPLGFTTSQVLGLSATLQELNISQERGSTAVNRILQKMTSNVEQFAKIAGVPVKQFEQMLNTDLYGAFLKVVEGSQRTGTSATLMAEVLKDGQLQGAGASEIFLKLGTALGILKDKVDLSNEAIKNTNSITNEYTLKQQTLGAELDKFGKKLYASVTNSTFSDWLASAVRGGIAFLDMLRVLPEWINKNAVVLTTLAGVTAMYYANMLKSLVATQANTTATLLKTAVERAGAIATNVLSSAQAAYITVTNLLTGRITLATAAQRLWNIAVASVGGVFTIAIAAVTAAAVAYQLYNRNTAEAIANERLKNDVSKRLTKTTEELQKANDHYAETIQKINRLSPIERAELEEKIKLKKKDAEATLEQIKADQKKIEKNETKAGLGQTVLNTVVTSFTSFGNPAKRMGDFASRQTDDALKNGQEAAAAFDDKISGTEQQVNALSNSLKTLQEVNNAEANAMAINATTTENYQEKLRLLKIALDNAVVGSEDYKRIQQELTSAKKDFALLNPEAASGDDPEDDTAKKLKEYRDNTKRLLDEMRQVKADVIADEEQRELESLKVRYEAKRAQIAAEKADGDVKAQLLSATDAKYIKDKQAIEAKYLEERRQEEFRTQQAIDRQRILAAKVGSKERLEAEKQAIDDRLAYDLAGTKLNEEEKKLAVAQAQSEKKELDTAFLKKQNDDFWNALIEQKQHAVDITREGTAERYAAEAELLQTQMMAELDAVDLTEQQKFEIKQRYEEMAMQMEQQNLQQRLQTIQTFYAGISNVINASLAYSKAKDDKELANDKHKNDQAKKQLKRRFDAGIIDKAEYEAKVQQIDDDYDAKVRAKRRKQAEQQKKWAIAQAVMNTALAVTNALATVQPFWAAIVAAALAAVAGGIQIAAISKEPIPEYAKGAKSTTGVIDGPSHTQEGIKLVNHQTGQVIGEMEGGEGIFSKEMYRNNKLIIDKIFEADGDSIPESKAAKVLFENGRVAAYSALNATNEETRMSNLNIYSNYQVEQIKMYRDYIATQNELDEFLFDKKVSRFTTEKELQEEISNRKKLQYEYEYKQIENYELVEAQSRTRVFNEQKRYYISSIAKVIGALDDGVIGKKEAEAIDTELIKLYQERRLGGVIGDVTSGDYGRALVNLDAMRISPFIDNPDPDEGRALVNLVDNEISLSPKVSTDVITPSLLKEMNVTSAAELPRYQFQSQPVLSSEKIERVQQIEKTTETLQLIQMLKETGIVPSVDETAVVSEKKIIDNPERSINNAMLENVHALLVELKENGVQGVWEQDRWQRGYDRVQKIKDFIKFNR